MKNMAFSGFDLAFALIFLPAGIQNVISKINPELIKTVIASRSVSPPFAPAKSVSVPSTPKSGQNRLPALPVYSPVLRYKKCSLMNEKNKKKNKKI